MEELNPKQIAFLTNYNDPKSETFGNALQSALKAGYSREYSESILSKNLDWMAENVGRRKRMLSKAEIRLETALDSEDERLAVDVAKFVAKTQGKNEGYSERTELTGKDGKELPTPILHNVFIDNSIEENSEPQEED